MQNTDSAPCSRESAASGAAVSTVTVTAITVADMVGIGAFTSLGFQIRDIPSIFSLIMLWVVGGIVALCGALSYAELAAAFPRSGGEYNFLSRIYHPAVGFLAGWVSATVGFAAPVALAAMAFGAYFKGVFPGAPALALALGVTWLVSLVHLSGVKQGGAFQNFSTLLKIGLMAALIVATLVVGEREPVSFLPSAQDLSLLTSSSFAICLVFVLYSYSGWNAGTYIIGEVRDPQRALPTAIFSALLIVMTLYVGLNAAFLYSTPLSQMSGQLDVGLIAGRHVFGDAGGAIVGLLICIGLVSSISAMTWIGPHVTMVMGEDLPLIRMFSSRTKNGVPAAAIIFQLSVTSILLLTQTFESIIDLIQFSITLCSFLAVLGIIVLRHTQPDLERPYRTWGYPVTPLIFLCVTLFVLVHLVTERPAQSLSGFLIILSGLAVYYLGVRRPAVKNLEIEHGRQLGVINQCAK